MFEIIKDGKVIATTEKANYIRLHPDGFYILCEKEEATGVAVDGVPYALRDGSLGDCETVVVFEVDGGRKLREQGEVNSITFVTLAEAGNIDDVTASEHIDAFSEWAANVNYTAGQMRKYGGVLYRCVTAHTSQETWTPDAAASLWAACADPNEEYPAWSRPVGAHDAYSKDSKVSHNEKKWTSDIDGNIWEPGVYGWTEVEAAS